MGLISRCHFLYERATKKFKGDLRLWLSWLEYCKKNNSTRQISKVRSPHSKPCENVVCIPRM